MIKMIRMIKTSKIMINNKIMLKIMIMIDKSNNNKYFFKNGKQ